MTSKQIRQTFLDFFYSKQHYLVSSAPLVVKDDPTLMFNNAGMNQFKDIFLENKIATHKRVVNTQKCLRVSGKHNDLEEVGLDGYHHTFFEMLGNWSFGDYFKEEAIAWAWELLTDVYQLPKDRLYVTVFGGDKGDKLEKDEEAKKIWSKYIAKERILEASKKDNFWEMGEVGPCGPCSEIHVDIRPDHERKELDGIQLVNKDHPLVIEIWNLVFIQYNRQGDGQLKMLPKQHIDTGLGLERLCMVIQGHQNNYVSDLFTPIIDKIKEITNLSISTVDFEKFNNNSKETIAIRVIADHLRAIVFSIADGLLPSNNKAGYVIRRILRRAVRYGFTFLNQKEPFLYKLVPILSDQFAEVFPELKEQLKFIQKILKQEENTFLNTLERGLKQLDEVISLTSNEKIITGKEAFDLYDTFGFPLDLTLLIASEKGYSVDEKGFNQAMNEQKTRSKASAVTVTGDWLTVSDESFYGFIGYDSMKNKTKILKYRLLDGQKPQENKNNVQVILQTTPFYAESGGQVGDQGYWTVGKEKISVLDTKKENDSYIHYIDKLPKELETEVITQIDVKKRNKTSVNHSATHLLHAALKQVLGNHIEQKGSLVNAKELRFDFNHFQKLSKEELEEINLFVNEKIFANIPLEEKRDIPIAEAKKSGATALFGEKYGDKVRVITFDSDYSVELCGGTHVKNTGEIGVFQITSESAVAAGVRRITAVTKKSALDYFKGNQIELQQVKSLLKHPKGLVQTVENLLLVQKEKQKELDLLLLAQQKAQKDQLITQFVEINNIPVLIEKVNVANNTILKNIIHFLAQEKKGAIIVLCAVFKEKPSLLVWIDKKWVEKKNLNANLLIKELSPLIKGGGGGQAFLASAGGKDVNGIEKVLTVAKQWCEKNL